MYYSTLFKFLYTVFINLLIAKLTSSLAVTIYVKYTFTAITQQVFVLRS